MAVWLRRTGIAAFCVGSSLAAAQPSPSGAPMVLTAWTHTAVGTAEFAALDESARRFNEAHPGYRVEVLPSIHWHYEDRVRTAAASGTLPCLLEFDGPYLASFAWLGYLQSIDRFVPRELLDDLLPSIVAQGTYDHRLFSLGQYDSGLGLWGNRRYLTRARVRIPSFRVPWSLQEFEQALQRLAEVRGPAYPLNLGIYPTATEFYSFAFSPMLQGFGGDLIDRQTLESSQGVIDGAASVAAMQSLQRWTREGWARVVLDRSDDFARGKAALTWDGHWQYPDLRKALGSDLVLLPLPDFGHGIKTGMGSWTWGISNSCPDPAGAWRFIAHLMSTEEILRMTGRNGAVPARRSALARSPLYARGGALHVYAQQLAAGLGVPRPATPAYGAISRAFARAVARILAGGDARLELGEAADAIDRDISAHRGYRLP